MLSVSIVIPDESSVMSRPVDRGKGGGFKPVPVETLAPPLPPRSKGGCQGGGLWDSRFGMCAPMIASDVMPNTDAAIFPAEKVRGYVLNFDSETGQHKARVVAAAFGLTANEDDIKFLSLALVAALPNGVVSRVHETKWGTKFDVELVITGRNGHVEAMSTTWQYDHGSDRPRLVTAFLRGKKK